MAHLPYIHLDPSQRLLSLIDLCQMDQVSPYNWSSLFGTVIAYDDLRPLVITLGLLLDKHKIVAHPSNFTKWTKEFICPTCSQFRLIFKCSKPHTHLASNHWLLKLQQPGHSAECPASTCVHHLSVLANLPALISHVRSVELEPRSAGRPYTFVDVQSNLLSQQLSTSLKKTSIHEGLGVHGEHMPSA